MNDDIKEIYINLISNESRSRRFSRLKNKIGRIFRYRIDIGFIDIVFQKMIVYEIDLISILYKYNRSHIS